MTDIDPKSPQDTPSSRPITGGYTKNFFKRRKICPFSGPDSVDIDYKDIRLLSKFISERGKILPSRLTAVSSKKQKELALAIKRARFLALLPYVNLG
jgi:small subunit ribosomal protein S18